jgi:hypothetical protein
MPATALFMRLRKAYGLTSNIHALYQPYALRSRINSAVTADRPVKSLEIDGAIGQPS